MINYTFGLTDVARVRFATSPLAELVCSIRALTGQTDLRYRSWMRSVISRVRSIDIAPLCAVIPPFGYIPDFLTPPPEAVVRDIDAELGTVRETPYEQVVADIEFLDADTNTPSAWRRTYAPMRRRLIADPAKAVSVLTSQLSAYWQAAITPYWPQMENRLRADLVRRSTVLGELGLGTLFGTLNDQLQWQEPQVTVASRYGYDVDLDGQGLILVPSLFGGSAVLTMLPPQQPTIFFPASGVARFFSSENLPVPPQLVALIGRLRASVLDELTVPESTTELANRLNATPGAISQHLTVLRNAGLVEGQRVGRQVLYARTPVGDALLGASLQ